MIAWGGPLTGHLGAEVSALVDDQLDDAAAQRAWDHVMVCSRCRSAVEREAWLKTRLSGLAGDVPLSPRLAELASLSAAWEQVEEIEARDRRRRRLMSAGAGSVGVAVLGAMALVGPAPVGRPDDRPVTAELTQWASQMVADGMGIAEDVWRRAAE